MQRSLGSFVNDLEQVAKLIVLMPTQPPTINGMKPVKESGERCKLSSAVWSEAPSQFKRLNDIAVLNKSSQVTGRHLPWCREISLFRYPRPTG